MSRENCTLDDFVADPDSPFAVVLVGSGVSLVGTRGNLDMARVCARNALREAKRGTVATIHRHNGGYGWQAGTEVVETMSK